MSSYPITGCGLPSKPRANEPSMFQILTWPGDQQSTKSRYQPIQQNANCLPQTQANTLQILNEGTKSVQQVSGCYPEVSKNKNPQPISEQIYKDHKSPPKFIQTHHKPQQIPQIIIEQNQQKIFSKSHLYKEQIKHQLNSYEPVNLKASRAKSANLAQKNVIKQTVQDKQQEIQLDQKVIKERKQKIKQFQLFTRILPNSAFTTYYGKPTFQNYGRGSSCLNLKSFNIMPHKGDNHPKNLQSHYTSLIKARNIKSKSYMPRKPIEQNLPLPCHQQDNQQDKVPSLPIQKPDLIKSKRFATVARQSNKKAGPPQSSKRETKSVKKTSIKNPQLLNQTKSKSHKQPLGDGLKYLNKRQNLIEILQEKKLKASQLAYKVTQCYPLDLELSNLQKSAVQKQNYDEHSPAGKPSIKGEPVSELIQSRLIPQQMKTKQQKA